MDGQNEQGARRGIEGECGARGGLRDALARCAVRPRAARVGIWNAPTLATELPHVWRSFSATSHSDIPNLFAMIHASQCSGVRVWRLMVLPGLAAAWLSGCTLASGTSTASKENDLLRAQVARQEETIRTLTGERDELQTKLGAKGGDAALLASIPVVTSIEIDRLSSLNPNRPDEPATSLSVYVTTLDGRARFTQAVGTLEVSVSLKDAAAPLAAAKLDAPALREAYRSGVTGTHYEVTLPVSPVLTRRAGEKTACLFRASFTDAATGKTFTTERMIER